MRIGIAVVTLVTLVACKARDRMSTGDENTLVRESAEAAGKNCQYGGTVFQSGTDANGDGVLEDNEVTSTHYVCSGQPLDVVTSLTATANRGSTLALSWTNPTSSSLKQVVIRRSTTGYPTSPIDGDFVYAGLGTSTEDTNLTPGVAYYYRAFAVAGAEVTTAGAEATATPLASGALDPSFNGTGFVTFPPPPDGGAGYAALAMAVDGSDRFLITGYFDNPSAGGGVWIRRLKPDGSLDTSFADGGTFTSDLLPGAPNLQEGASILTDSEGRIVVGAALGHDLALVRVLSDGSPDLSFADGGLASYGANNTNFEPQHYLLSVDGSGRILVGVMKSGSATTSALIRFNSDGSLDTGYNSSGRVDFDSMPDWAPYPYPILECSGAAVDASGKIVVATYGVAQSFPYEMGVWRENADGTLDTTFGASGLSTEKYGNLTYTGPVKLDGSGRILLVGYLLGYLDWNPSAVLWRFLPDGGMDPSFSGTGMLDLSPSLQLGYPVDFALGVESRIWVAGMTAGATGGEVTVVWRATDSGQLDSSFGDGGTAVYENPAGDTSFDVPLTIATDSQGRPYVLGVYELGNGLRNSILRRIIP